MFDFQTTAQTIGLFRDNYPAACKATPGTYHAREKTTRSREKIPQRRPKNNLYSLGELKYMQLFPLPGKNFPGRGRKFPRRGQKIP